MASFVLVGSLAILAVSGPRPATSTAPQPQPPPPTSVTAARPSLPPDPRPPRPRPFDGLFAAALKPDYSTPVTPAARAWGLQRDGSAGPRAPEVVCGTRVFRGDPDIDPGIIRRNPDTRTRFTMRRFVWPGCEQ